MEKKLFGDSKMDTFDTSIVYIINLDFSIFFAHFSHTTTLYEAIMMLLYGMEMEMVVRGGIYMPKTCSAGVET